MKLPWVKVISIRSVEKHLYCKCFLKFSFHELLYLLVSGFEMKLKELYPHFWQLE